MHVYIISGICEMHFNFWGQQPHFLGPIYVLLSHDNQSLLYFKTENKLDFLFSH